MKGKMLELKNLLKQKAIEIRIARNTFKDEQRKNHYYGYVSMIIELENMVWEYRHHHIAYSELRGRTRDEIERPREDNEPDESYIETVKEAYRNEETLRLSA